ncbi:MAG: hypothetical protein MJB14_02610 [Spirochaetes bacterium]|nr:hypothetical protein [Spirochaetota bacterium]
MKSIQQQLEKKGYQVSMFEWQHVKDLRKEIKALYEKNKISSGVFQNYLEKFYQQDQFDWKPRSILIVSYPHFPTSFIFNWQGIQIKAIVPPAYLHVAEGDKKVKHMINQTIQAYSNSNTEYRAEIYNKIPEKLAAVRSGLAKYGKNNITYVPNYGSYHRLVAFVTNLPCEQDNWQAREMMDNCKNCRICQKKCPTSAIERDNFLINHEHCLTFHNEEDSKVKFPEWIKSNSHNCLIGCLVCQQFCPLNQKVKNQVIVGVEFKENETAELLQGNKITDFSKKLAEKLNKADLFDLLSCLPRNLKVLLEKAEREDSY